MSAVWQGVEPRGEQPSEVGPLILDCYVCLALGTALPPTSWLSPHSYPGPVLRGSWRH